MQQPATAMDMDLDLDLDLAKVQEGSRRLRWLLDYEASNGRLSVISVWGTGGNLGTISIIRNAFDNPNFCQVFKCRAWVKLMHPFSPQKFLGDLVAQLLTNSGTTCGADILSNMKVSLVDLAKQVEELVKDGAYFIVLEDLSNMVEWDTIRTYLPDEKNGSQVVVSTQHRQIARLCIGQPHYVQELSQLSADHYVYAFFKEIRMPSQQDQGSMDVASLSAAANYWYCVHLNGRDEEVCQLTHLICSSETSPTHVVTVLGPPNVGKDVVVAKVCSQWVLNNRFTPFFYRRIQSFFYRRMEGASPQQFSLELTPSFELYGWVDVWDPFSVQGLCESLLSCLRPKSPYSEDPVGECSRLLSQHRCLVVIYGLQCTQDCLALERAGLINKHPNNSCIVVVTTEPSVATYWTKATTSAGPSATSSAVCKIEPIAHVQDFTYCLTGHDEELCQLYDMISSSRDHYYDEPHVLTVWGPPGVGKSTLVSKVYSSYMLMRHPSSPFQLYGWVNVSSSNSSPLTLEQRFSQSLLSYMRPQLAVLRTQATARRPRPQPADPVQECSNLLTRWDCLVVIDGLQSIEDLNKLINARLIVADHNSCFILITGDESVATFCKEKTSPVPYAVCNVKPLNVQQQGQLPTPGSMARLFYMANCAFSKYSSIVGRNAEVSQLSRMISSPRGRTSSSHIVVVWGPTGVGKTALVEEVYSQFMLNRSAPFVRCGWVQVSNTFNLMGFYRSLLSVLRPQSPESPDPIQDCSNLVRSQPCLIVIDGLQSTENFWELANSELTYGHPKGCIVLITTECMASVFAQLQVKPLHRNCAWDLFGQVCEQGLQDFCYSHIYSSLVVDKCCGFPIVILAVAKYLMSCRSEDAVTQFTAAVKEGKFIHELPAFVGLKGLLAWVDSNIKACPQSLKLLVSYMHNFSQATVVRRKRLVWRWIAEGYFKNTGICDMVAEAEERIRELEYLTVIMRQVVEGGRHRGYQLISGFSGEALMSRAAEDPLFLPLEVSVLTEGRRGLTSRGCVGRHLRIDSKWEETNEYVFRSLDLSRLRSLTVYRRFRSFFINNDSMKVLRVLDLEDADGIEYDDLKEIPKLLPRLRFLSLRGCSFPCLPDSIGELRQLQTLDIRRTKIATLPDSILKLRNLQCLRAGHTMKAWTVGDSYTPAWRRISSRLASCTWQTLRCASQGVTMPRGFSSQLTALHTLGIVNVNTAGGEATLEELGDLKQLRKLELYGINSYNVRGLRHLPYALDNLSLGFTKDRDATSSNFEIDLSVLWSRRQRLKLYGHVGILSAAGIREVTDLSLEIDDSTCFLAEGNIKRIGNLPRVRTLRLHVHTHQGAGGKLKFDANNDDGQKYFPTLEVLEISSLLESTPLDVEFAPEALMNLEVLKFVGSLQMGSGLHHLLSLKEVWIDGRPHFVDAMVKELDGHPNKPAVIQFESWPFLRDPEYVSNRAYFWR